MKRQRQEGERERDTEGTKGSQANSKTIETLSLCTYIISYIISLLLNLQINASLPQLRLCVRCVCPACNIWSNIKANAGAMYVI